MKKTEKKIKHSYLAIVAIVAIVAVTILILNSNKESSTVAGEAIGLATVSTIAITSTPAGAEVKGYFCSPVCETGNVPAFSGTTTYSKTALKPGKYRLTFTKEGYVSVTKEVTLGAGSNIVTQALQNSPNLIVDTIPSDANIKIWRCNASSCIKSTNTLVATGTTPYKSALSSGSYEIGITKTNFLYFSQRVTLDSGAIAVMHKTYELTPGGKFSLVTTPSGATAQLYTCGNTRCTSKSLGMMGWNPSIITPYTVPTEMPVGAYYVEFSKSGYNKAGRIFSIQQGTTTAVNAVLTAGQ